MDCFLFLDFIRSTYDLNSLIIKLYYSSSIFSQVWVTDKLKKDKNYDFCFHCG